MARAAAVVLLLLAACAALLASTPESATQVEARRAEAPAHSALDDAGPIVSTAALSPAELAPPAPDATAQVAWGDAIVELPGVVTDDEGRPLAGATVEARDGSSVARTTTDVAGGFRLVARRRSTIVARAPGYLERETCAGDPQTTLALELAGTLRGVALGPSGPVAGVVVKASRVGWAEPRVEARCDADGRFLLDGLPEGRYEVGAVAESGLRSCVHTALVPPGATVEVATPLLEVHDQLQVLVSGSSGRWLTREGVTVLVDGAPLPGPWAPVGLPCEVQARRGALVGRALVPSNGRSVEVELEPSRQVEVELVGTQPPYSRLSVLCRTGEQSVVSLPVVGETPSTLALELPRDHDVELSFSWEELGLRRVVPVGQLRLRLEVPLTGLLFRGGGYDVRVSADEEWYDDLEQTRFFAGRLRAIAVDEYAGLAAAGWVDLAPESSLVVDLPLAPAARVRGRLVDPAGRPVGRTPLFFAGLYCVTDSAGRFAQLLPAGRWPLRAHTRELEVHTGLAGARLPGRFVEVTGPGDIDLGDLVVRVE